MRFRPFSNADPPQLARLWTAQPASRGMAQRVNAQLLEAYVFAKPYFERQGLTVAEDDSGRIVGFAHGGFGPNALHNNVCTELGVTCMVMVAPDFQDSPLGGQLIERTEAYLRGRGARVLYGGGVYPLNPFYLGLYGGSELPGILASDGQRLRLFEQQGYSVIDRCVVLQRDMSVSRLPVDRRLMTLKRHFRVQMDGLTRAADWWDSCSMPPGEPMRFEVVPTTGGPAYGSVRFWIMEPLSATWGALSVGMTNLAVDAAHRRQGLAMFLNCEALRQLQLNGVSIVEVQTMESNIAALSLYKKLGFVEVDRGLVLRK